MAEAPQFTKAVLQAEFERRAWPVLRDKHPDLYLQEVEYHLRRSFTRKQREILAAIEGGERYVALCAARRAGKTGFLVRYIVLTLLKAQRNEQVTYVAESLKDGKRFIWADLIHVIETYQLPWEVRGDGEVKTPRGAQFVIKGLNKIKQSNVGHGLKSILFAIDECQDYEHLLQPLRTAVGPSLMEHRGVFLAAGTPGHVPDGTWYEWTRPREEVPTNGFLAFPPWTIHDNERFLRDPEETLREERKTNGWTEDHPDYQREHLGRWAQDVSQFVCEFRSIERSKEYPNGNVLTVLPESYGPHWKHVLGIDFGWRDSIAWTVIAVDPYSPERIVVHSEATNQIDNDKAAEITARIIKRFGITLAVCDPSGGGVAFYEGVFNVKYGKSLGCSIRGAYKLGKVESVRTLNTEFRTGRLTLYLPPPPEPPENGAPEQAEEFPTGAHSLARELRQLRWKDRQKGEVLTSDHMRDDGFDSFRMAHVEVAPMRPRVDPRNNPERDAQRALQERTLAGDQEAALEARIRLLENYEPPKNDTGYGWGR